MASKTAAKIDTLIAKALERIKRNLTDHVFWEIQRNTDLFREYISIITGEDGENKKTAYRTVHRRIANTVKKTTGAKSVKAGKAGNSALNQTFTRFDPKTVRF